MLLALAACNKIETNVQPVENNEGIPFSATISVGNNATTKALAESGSTIVATWAVDETVALIHNGVKDEMTVSAVNEGVATITGIITGSPSDGDAVTVIYPASAADGTTGNVKADLLYAQNGLLTGTNSIAEKFDVRKGSGTLKVSGTASLNGNTSLTNEFAIFKFTVKNSDASATIDVKPLTVTIGSQDYVITPASATSELFVALPAISGEAVSFTATGSDSKTYTCSKASVTFSAGKYYQSIIKMAEAAPAAATGHALSASAVGEVVGTDGMAYDVADKDNLPTGVTAAGMVAYKSGTNGLVIALADEASKMDWSTANGATTGAAAHTPAVTGQTWKLPSQDEWKQMFSANGGNDSSYTGLNTALAAAGGDSSKLQDYDDYWSSTEIDDSQAYAMWLLAYNGSVMSISAAKVDNPNPVRACFAF